MKAFFHKGTVVVRGRFDLESEDLVWDSRIDAFRCLAYKWLKIRQQIRPKPEEDVFHPIGYPKIIKNPILRPYQIEAFRKWEETKSGVIVLPTGAGKTLVGINAICELRVPTLVVVPTLDLLSQWVSTLSDYVISADEWSGRRKMLAPVVVSTYDSAHISADYLGDKFTLLIFDEVHHLPAETYRQIAQMSVAEYRMGLTATQEREDQLHLLLSDLVGPKVFEITASQLKGSFLSDWEIVTIKIEMTPDEMKEYRKNIDYYRSCMLSLHLNPGNKRDFLRLIRLSAKNPKAREALLAFQKAKKISFNSENKIEKLREILTKHKNEKTIIFTRYQEMVFKISKEFLIPKITSDTPTEERKEYFQGFKNGKFRAIASAQALDEGIDVPDASVGVIVSGTSSQREFIQRLGRILRPSKPKALLYELISLHTSEKYSASRRKGKI